MSDQSISDYARSMFEGDDLITRYLSRPKPSGVPTNLFPLRGGEHEITNHFFLRESGAFVSGDLPPLHSYD